MIHSRNVVIWPLIGRCSHLVDCSRFQHVHSLLVRQDCSPVQIGSTNLAIGKFSHLMLWDCVPYRTDPTYHGALASDRNFLIIRM